MADYVYPWQSHQSSIENYSFKLEIRRLELLETMEKFSAQEYDQKLIDEWLFLTRERDRIFRDLHRKSIVRDLNNSILLAFESLKNTLRLNFLLQNNEIPSDLRKTVARCAQEIGQYVKENKIEPVQIILLGNETADDIFLPPVFSNDDDKDCTKVSDLMLANPCSFEKKVDEWQIKCSNESESDFVSPIETQSNATFESCLDSILVSSVNRKRIQFGTRPFIINGQQMGSVDFHSKYVDQIKEILNSSFD